jgi:hypothetical protein
MRDLFIEGINSEDLLFIDLVEEVNSFGVGEDANIASEVALDIECVLI